MSRLPAGVVEIESAEDGRTWLAFQCFCCGRTQAYAPPSQPGGITAREAAAIGWARIVGYVGVARRFCPFCSGKATLDRSVMGSRERGGHTRRCAAALALEKK